MRHTCALTFRLTVAYSGGFVQYSALEVFSNEMCYINLCFTWFYFLTSPGIAGP